MLQKKYLLRLMKEKFEPAQCTTGGGLREKKRLQYITGIVIFNTLQIWSLCLKPTEIDDTLIEIWQHQLRWYFFQRRGCLQRGSDRSAGRPKCNLQVYFKYPEIPGVTNAILNFEIKSNFESTFTFNHFHLPFMLDKLRRENNKSMWIWSSQVRRPWWQHLARRLGGDAVWGW